MKKKYYLVVATGIPYRLAQEYDSLAEAIAAQVRLRHQRSMDTFVFGTFPEWDV